MERSKTLGIRVSDEEQTILQQSASDLGMTVSEYIRAIGLQGIERVTYDPELHAVIRGIQADCRRIATDIHEIAVRHNESVDAIIATRQCEEQLVALHKTMRSIENLLTQI